MTGHALIQVDIALHIRVRRVEFLEEHASALLALLPDGRLLLLLAEAKGELGQRVLSGSLGGGEGLVEGREDVGEGGGERILLELRDGVGEDEPPVERYEPFRSLERLGEHEREQRGQRVQRVRIALEVERELAKMEAALHGLVEEAEDACCDGPRGGGREV